MYFEPCLQLLKKNELEQIEKSQQVYHGEKEEERISVILNTVIHDAENLGFDPVLEFIMTKTQPGSRNLRFVMRCMTLQHTRREGCLSQSRSTV